MARRRTFWKTSWATTSSSSQWQTTLALMRITNVRSANCRPKGTTYCPPCPASSSTLVSTIYLLILVWEAISQQFWAICLQSSGLNFCNEDEPTNQYDKASTREIAPIIFCFTLSPISLHHALLRSFSRGLGNTAFWRVVDSSFLIYAFKVSVS